MSEETQDPKEAGDPQAAEPKNDDPLSALSDDAKKLFEETQAGLLSALKKERKANEDAANKIAAIEKEAQTRLEAQLQEQGKFKELADERAKALIKATKRAERYDTALETLEKVLETQLEAIPETKRGLVPAKYSVEDKLEWIAKNRALLSKSQPFSIGAGETGGSGEETLEITSEDRAAAKKVGMSPDDYVKYS